MSDIVEVMKAVRAELDAKGIKLDVDETLRELAGPSLDEIGVALAEVAAARQWIVDKTGVGGGSRPLSFLIASHDYMAAERAQALVQARTARDDLHALRALNADARRAYFHRDEPIPILLSCPDCGTRHVDQGDFATKPHHTHACQTCGLVWRPAIEHTVGVRFLPGFKDP